MTSDVKVIIKYQRSKEMSSMRENINQAIADFDGIKTAIESLSVEVPHGTDTKDYASLIESISTVEKYLDKTLTSVTTQVETMPVYALYGSSIQEFSAPNCTILKSHCFEWCEHLKNVYIPNCERIEAQAFHDCTELTKIDLGQCTYLANQVFESCTNLQTVILRSTCYDGLTFSVTPNSGNQKTTLEVQVGNKTATFTIGSGTTNCTLPFADYGITPTSSMELYIRATGGNTSNLTISDIYAYRSERKKILIDWDVNTNFWADGSNISTSVADCITVTKSSGKNLIGSSGNDLSGVCTLSNVNAFAGCNKFKSSTGKLYIPDELVEEYKTATNWASIYATGTQFLPLSDLEGE